MRAPLRLLTSDQLEQVHAASLAILDRVGMDIDHEGARDLLRRAGARSAGDGLRVRFPPELVEEKLALVPRRTEYHGRTQEFDISIEQEGPIYARVSMGAIAYVDLSTRQYRPAKIADCVEFAILADALPHINCVADFHCSDVPAPLADLHSLKVLLEKQRHCIVHNAFTARNLEWMIEMMLVVQGGRRAIEQRPQLHVVVSPISPLFLQHEDTEQLLIACEYGLPTDLPIMPMPGATAPITLASVLALANAEFLGTMTLAECAKPGHVMPYFLDPVIGDLRTFNALYAAPESPLLIAAIQQLGLERYGLPPQGVGLDSDGYDYAQTAFQKAQNACMQVMAGGKLIVGAGSVASCMALDPVQLVIDDAIMTNAQRWSRGISVSESRLAVDVIERVGPRGNFLADEHTIEFLRSGELIEGDLFERTSRELWSMRGAMTLEEKAREKAMAILSSHRVPALADDVSHELEGIIQRATASLNAGVQ